MKRPTYEDIYWWIFDILEWNRMGLVLNYTDKPKGKRRIARLFDNIDVYKTNYTHSHKEFLEGNKLVTPSYKDILKEKRVLISLENDRAFLTLDEWWYCPYTHRTNMVKGFDYRFHSIAERIRGIINDPINYSLLEESKNDYSNNYESNKNCKKSNYEGKG